MPFSFCNSQQIRYDNNIYRGILSDLYLNHQPYAKSEAMARGLVANSNGSFGSYYNPSLTSLNEGISFDYSYSQADAKKPSLNYYQLSYSKKKLGSIGVSAYYFSKAPESIYGFEEHKRGSYYDALYTINYSREVIKDMYAGINVGVYHFHHFYYQFFGMGYPGNFAIHDGLTLDLGLLKKFTIEAADVKHTFQLGAAAYNITDSRVESNDDYAIYTEPLPIIVRAGVSYQFKAYNAGSEIDAFETFTHFEFEKTVNSVYPGVFKIGQEVSFADIFFFRGGILYRKKPESDYSYYFGFTKQKYEPEFTAGFGVSIPIHKIFDIRNTLNLKVDYSTVDEGNINLYEYYYDNDKYNVFSIGLNLTL